MFFRDSTKWQADAADQIKFRSILVNRRETLPGKETCGELIDPTCDVKEDDVGEVISVQCSIK